MTLHIKTVTPRHTVIVSDRLISTPVGYLELGDDRHKHLVLICDDAGAVVGFTGFAGIPKKMSDGKYELKESSIDWLTNVITETCKAKKHSINAHIADIQTLLPKRVEYLQRKYRLSLDKLQMIVQIAGMSRGFQFDIIVENCLDGNVDIIPTRSSFNCYKAIYEDKHFEESGSRIMILGQRQLALDQNKQYEKLEEAAKVDNAKEIFDASVKLIRSVAPLSGGTVGTNCSGIRISKGDNRVESMDSRDQSIYNLVMPNCVTSKTGSGYVIKDIQGYKV